MKRPLFFLLCIVLLSCTAQAPVQDSPTDVSFAHGYAHLVPPKGNGSLTIDDLTVPLDVEMAETSVQQERGLMFRDHLDDGHGMLFVFADERLRSFWMKNTRIPLDIVFFDRSGQFVSAASMDPCTADPCPSYQSGGAAQYALELPAGYVSKRGIGQNWKLQ